MPQTHALVIGDSEPTMTMPADDGAGMALEQYKSAPDYRIVALMNLIRRARGKRWTSSGRVSKFVGLIALNCLKPSSTAGPFESSRPPDITQEPFHTLFAPITIRYKFIRRLST